MLILTGDQVHGQGRDLLRRKLGVFEELKGCSGLSMELEDTVREMSLQRGACVCVCTCVWVHVRVHVCAHVCVYIKGEKCLDPEGRLWSCLGLWTAPGRQCGAVRGRLVGRGGWRGSACRRHSGAGPDGVGRGGARSQGGQGHKAPGGDDDGLKRGRGAWGGGRRGQRCGGDSGEVGHGTVAEEDQGTPPPPSEVTGNMEMPFELKNMKSRLSHLTLILGSCQV